MKEILQTACGLIVLLFFLFEKQMNREEKNCAWIFLLLFFCMTSLINIQGMSMLWGLERAFCATLNDLNHLSGVNRQRGFI